MIQTTNFNPLTDKKILCTCGHKDCDKRSVTQEHLERVQMVRDRVDHPLAVTSGGRCSHHPDEMHRAKPADHQKGLGVDVACSGSTRGNIVKAGIESGCNAIGVAKTFVHLGYRESLPKGHLTVWVY